MGADDAKLLKQFASIMTDSERDVMAAMMGRLTDVLDAANLTYHMCGGTLIGSYRHHGMVPWDDDVDIYARWNERDRLESEFKRHLSQDYVLKKASTRWKLYSRRQSAVIPGWRWKYPFVDICFVLESDTLVWDYDNAYGRRFRYQRSTVYPLRRRPFMNLTLWAPNDVETYLRTTYDIDRCKSNAYIHKDEKDAKQVHSVDCHRLWPYYPFVFRSKVTSAPTGPKAGAAEAVVEELRIGSRVLSTFAVGAVV
jgi:LicD family